MERVDSRGGSVGAPDAGDVETVTECIELLQGANAKVKLYGPQHPQTVIAVTAFIERLNALLEWLGPITLETSPTGLTWRQQPVSDERDDRVGIGRHCHTEGISMLGFSPGVFDDEIHRLLGALRVNLSLPMYEEETLESLLYQAELTTISFRAISSLMDAEALSGREDDRGIGQYLTEKLIETRAGDMQAGRPFSGVLSPADVAGGDVVDRWELDAGIDSALSDDEWGERFAIEAGEDRPLIEGLRDDVRYERSAQLLSRLVMILLRSECAGRPEVGRGRANALAVSVIRQIYALGDPVGILEVLESGHALSEEVRAVRPDLTEEVRSFLRQAYSPLRVARLLRNLDPVDPVEANALGRFLDIFPDTAILAFFEGVARDGEGAERRPLLAFVCGRIGAKLEGWLGQASMLPTDQLEPIVHGLRVADPPQYRPWRSHLVRHSSGRVRAATLRWYEDSLPPEDVRAVTELLLDRASAVRDAASRVLVRHRPAAAVSVLTSTLTNEAFATLDADRKTELCVTFGRLSGPVGLQVLSDLLATRLGLLRDNEAIATVTAAARGLAALGTANAVIALEKGARGIGGGARRSACQAALAILESERAQEVARGG